VLADNSREQYVRQLHGRSFNWAAGLRSDKKLLHPRPIPSRTRNCRWLRL